MDFFAAVAFGVVAFRTGAFRVAGAFFAAGAFRVCDAFVIGVTSGWTSGEVGSMAWICSTEEPAICAMFSFVMVIFRAPE